MGKSMCVLGILASVYARTMVGEGPNFFRKFRYPHSLIVQSHFRNR